MNWSCISDVYIPTTVLYQSLGYFRSWSCWTLMERACRELPWNGPRQRYPVIAKLVEMRGLTSMHPKNNLDFGLGSILKAGIL